MDWSNDRSVCRGEEIGFQFWLKRVETNAWQREEGSPRAVLCHHFHFLSPSLFPCLWSSCSFHLVLFLLTAYSLDLWAENSPIVFVKGRLFCMALVYYCRELPQYIIFCRCKGFVTTNPCLRQTHVCHDKTRLLSPQKYACHDKTFAATENAACGSSYQCYLPGVLPYGTAICHHAFMDHC